MSRGTYTRIANRIKQSTFVLPIFIFVVACFALATIRTAFDFYTNLLGVDELNIKSFGVPFVDIVNKLTVAFMPQVLTMVCWYIALAMEPANKMERWIRAGAFFMGISATIVDIYLGFVFYAQPDGSGSPLLMSAFVDTFFSEIAWTVSFGLMLELVYDAKREFTKLVRAEPPAPRAKSKNKGPAHQQSPLEFRSNK